MNYTLHQLRIFLCVVRNESITKAAEELFLTQPAVSIQLKKLQEQFEIPLTEVLGRQLHITKFGREIAIVAEKVLTANEGVRHTVEQYKGLLSGKINFAVVSTGKYVMPYLLSGFVKQHPQVQVQMDVTNKTFVVDALAKNETDFALVSVLPDQMEVITMPLMENQLFLVANQQESERLSNRRKLSVQKLKKLPLIFREQGSATRMAMERFLKSHNIPLDKFLSLTSNEAVKQAVNAGLGFSIMPLIGLRNALSHDEFRIVPMTGLPIVTRWMLVYRKGKSLSPAAKAYLAYLEANKESLIEEHFSWTKSFVDKIAPS